MEDPKLIDTPEPTVIPFESIQKGIKKYSWYSFYFNIGTILGLLLCMVLGPVSLAKVWEVYWSLNLMTVPALSVGLAALFAIFQYENLPWDWRFRWIFSLAFSAINGFVLIMVIVRVLYYLV